MAILSRPFYLILRSRPDVVVTWVDTEVARRWLMRCPICKNQDRSAKVIFGFGHQESKPGTNTRNL